MKSTGNKKLDNLLKRVELFDPELGENLSRFLSRASMVKNHPLENLLITDLSYQENPHEYAGSSRFVEVTIRALLGGEDKAELLSYIHGMMNRNVSF